MKTRDYVPATPCVCINLRRIAQKVTDFYDKTLEPAGVSVNQYSLLVNVSRREGCGTGELARRVKLEKSTLVRTLAPLLRDGLIVDESTGKSRRRQLFLTPAGEDVLKKAFPLWNEAQEAMAGKLGKSHQQLLDIFAQAASWE